MPNRPPAYMQPPLVQRFPEFRRREAAGVPRAIAEACPVGEWPCAVGHVAVMDFHRGDFELAGYARAHGQLTNGWRKFLMRFLHSSTGSQDRTVAVTDEGGTSRNLRFAVTGGAVAAPSIARWPDSVDPKLKYGDSNAAVNGAHTDLQAVTKYEITASEVTYDDTNSDVTIAGSRVHSEAAFTIRELGLFQKYRHTGAAFAFFMADRSLPTATAVATDQSVAITYEVAF